jgi:hypothetical protein
MIRFGVLGILIAVPLLARRASAEEVTYEFSGQRFTSFRIGEIVLPEEVASATAFSGTFTLATDLGTSSSGVYPGAAVSLDVLYDTGMSASAAGGRLWQSRGFLGPANILYSGWSLSSFSTVDATNSGPALVGINFTLSDRDARGGGQSLLTDPHVLVADLPPAESIDLVKWVELVFQDQSGTAYVRGHLSELARKPDCQLAFVPFHQGGPQPDVPKTFGRNSTCTLNWGCALCATASLLTSFADLTEMTPSALDDLLKVVDGYDDDDRLKFDRIPAAVESYEGKAVQLFGSRDTPVPDLDEYLEREFCRLGRAVILDLRDEKTAVGTDNTETGTHYVLVVGKNEGDWELFDPGWRHAEPQDALTSLKGHQDGFVTTSGTGTRYHHVFEVTGVRTFGSADKKCGLAVTCHSPAELLVSSPSGELLGYRETGDVIEISDGSYFRDYPLTGDDGGVVRGDPTGTKTAYVPFPESGAYAVRVSGTDLGTYTLEIAVLGVDGGLQTRTLFGVTDTGVTSSYEIAVSPESTSPLAGVGHVVTVVSLIEAIGVSRRLGAIDNDGVARSLTQKLRAVESAVDRGQKSVAQNGLRAFVKEVAAQSGEHIEVAVADLLVAQADSLLE